MANLSEDIQCVGFDTQPPMLDMTDFASWQQRIRLYCRGKENEFGNVALDVTNWASSVGHQGNLGEASLEMSQMANLSEDIQYAGFDTRPPMLDRTDFVSWQQRIRLYCRGKENGVNILKLIDEGPFQMGTLRETLAEGIEGAFHLGPERPRVYYDLSPEEKERYNADIRQPISYFKDYQNTSTLLSIITLMQKTFGIM
nr:integrase, catalytic region, zinc finger, CCHC-type, peptidase aspartic, catalytic [Tanacetum cinerariifolium]